MSAPESSSIGTSCKTLPVIEFRKDTFAGGAGGANLTASYAGIVAFLDDLLREIMRLFWMHQTRATDVSDRQPGIRNNHKDSCFLWQAHVGGQTNKAVFDNPFKRRDTHKRSRFC